MDYGNVFLHSPGQRQRLKLERLKIALETKPYCQIPRMRDDRRSKGYAELIKNGR